MEPRVTTGQEEGITPSHANVCSRGKIQTAVLLVLLVVGLSSLSIFAVLYAGSQNGASTLRLTVSEQQSLTVVGSNVILKLRLLPGVTAKLWGDKTCGAPIQKAMLITASGNYVIPLANVPHQNRDYVCLLSSNAHLNASAVWPPVHSDNTTTGITSHSPNPSLAGQLATIGFTVSPATSGIGTPTGDVTVSDGLGDTCTATVSAGSCTITFAAAGSKNLTATYAGDDNFNTSTSPGVTHTVNRINTTTAIASRNPSPSVAGQPVVVGFTVTPSTSGLGDLSGNVTVSDGVGDTCTASVAAGSCSLAFAASGTKTLTASYAGDATYNPSASVGVSHNVSDFSISIAPAAQTVKAGSSTTYTLTVTPGGGFTGTVNLTCGGAPPSSTCTMSPSSIVLSGPGAGTRTVSVTTSNSTGKGNYTLTFTGKFGSGVPASGGSTHVTTASLKVN